MSSRVFLALIISFSSSQWAVFIPIRSSAADFFSTPRSEFVVEQLYRYGLRFSVLAMLGCLTEDTFGFGMRVICGGSLPHLFPLYDILVIMYLMRSVKQNDLKLEKKMVAAEKLGGRMH
ncbi:hypothetical protein ACLB2K_059333 [Fragaria x ananassa]